MNINEPVTGLAAFPGHWLLGPQPEGLLGETSVQMLLGPESVAGPFMPPSPRDPLEGAGLPDLSDPESPMARGPASRRRVGSGAGKHAAASDGPGQPGASGAAIWRDPLLSPAPGLRLRAMDGPAFPSIWLTWGAVNPRALSPWEPGEGLLRSRDQCL